MNSFSKELLQLLLLQIDKQQGHASFFHLLSWHSFPSGKQSLPLPVLVFRPQSEGSSSSRPVATGFWVPSSLKRSLFPKRLKPPSGARKRLASPRRNWASPEPLRALSRANTVRAVNGFILATSSSSLISFPCMFPIKFI